MRSDPTQFLTQAETKGYEKARLKDKTCTKTLLFESKQMQREIGPIGETDVGLAQEVTKLTATCKMTEHCRSNNLDVGARENHARVLMSQEQLRRRDVRTDVPRALQLACLSPQSVSVILTCDAFGMGQSSDQQVSANSKQAICCLQ